MNCALYFCNVSLSSPSPYLFKLGMEGNGPRLWNACRCVGPERQDHFIKGLWLARKSKKIFKREISRDILFSSLSLPIILASIRSALLETRRTGLLLEDFGFILIYRHVHFTLELIQESSKFSWRASKFRTRA